ncbi:putative bifunctional diguanylate cyclase/phosphodiesterase [Pseudoteredinibacter isoporae]|uniref:Diguanylate cyclase (GGDEF)-like protein n=1 Tax=Pseudoteredinibacter isoporae TaxID=570281 RepID=A0A7X0JTY1_9GAMM|nr:EAL domain-containing protein [Pseudoteredinibacter isoporae]MBB6522207.1 diguanylate cyclase (GGDEF)-like protein [Pseudoteredinibacter isoporae]NHO87741.1 EAL domain-containing protein [Pseudoteredinibacter isoporae]NIB23928.1 EAL domain-containing protein [Pseudoteredinibacter isoporae]
MAELSQKRSTAVLSLTLGSVIICLALLLTLLSHNAFNTHSQDHRQATADALQQQGRQSATTQIKQLLKMAGLSLQTSPRLPFSSNKTSKPISLQYQRVFSQFHELDVVQQVFLIDQQHTILLPQEFAGQNLSELLHGKYSNLMTLDNGQQFAKDQEQRLLLQAVDKLGQGLLNLAIEFNLSSLPANAVDVESPPEVSLTWWALLIMFAMCLAAVAYFSWVLSRSEHASLSTLRRYAQTLAKGDYFSTLKLNSRDPLSDMASALQKIGEHLHEQQRRLIRLSYRDSLTGLANRHQFFKWLAEQLKHNQVSGQPFALLIIDLDQFKRVNDSLGHEIGDEILLEVAGRLRQVITSFHRDCAEDELAYLARFSGDEFGILLPKIDGGHDAILLAQRIQAAMLEPLHNGEHVLHLGASIGICLCPEDGKTPALLLKNAEMAMYQAKAAGPNNFQFFAEFMSLSAIKRLNVEVELQHAFDNKELRLFYQPKFDVRRRQMVGSEALLRWQHPQRGLIGPDYFLEVAEQTALIAQIGRWVTREVCRQLKEWQGSDLGNLPVALNISAAEFQLRDVVGDLRDSLHRYQLDPGLLQMEVTETTIASQEDKIGRDLTAIRRLGVKVWIDDFGTGYSSLGYLRRFSVDGVKIDRSFVHEVAHNPADAALCSAIVAMASQLQLDVVAEGVEEREQFNLLLESGCSQAQGFFYARPMSPDVLHKQAGQLLQLSAHGNLQSVLLDEVSDSGEGSSSDCFA